MKGDEDSSMYRHVVACRESGCQGPGSSSGLKEKGGGREGGTDEGSSMSRHVGAAAVVAVAC
jgi:hypothetical protein